MANEVNFLLPLISALCKLLHEHILKSKANIGYHHRFIKFQDDRNILTKKKQNYFLGANEKKRRFEYFFQHHWTRFEMFLSTSKDSPKMPVSNTKKNNTCTDCWIVVRVYIYFNWGTGSCRCCEGCVNTDRFIWPGTGVK